MIKRPKQKICLLIVVQLMLSTGCDLPFLSGDTSDVSSQNPDEKQMSEVYIESFMPRQVFTPVKLAGFIRLRDQAPLYSPVSGVITKQVAAEGDLVAKNKVILSIKPDHQGIQSRQYHLNAPLAGTLVRWKKKLHEHINANEDLGLIANLKTFEIETFVSSGDFSGLSTGQYLSAFISDQNSRENTELKVQVKKMTPVVDEKTLAYPVTFDIICNPNDPCFSAVRSGLIAEILIKKNLRTAYLVPSKYLHKRSTQMIVADQEGKARFIDIKTGEIFGDESEITSGLDLNMRVVTMYSKMPSDGDPLSVVKEGSPESEDSESRLSSHQETKEKVEHSKDSTNQES